MRIVVAIGGNALLRRGEIPDSKTQVTRLAEAAPALVRLAAEHQVVIVHGNGPQVGLLAMENGDDRSLSTRYLLSSPLKSNNWGCWTVGPGMIKSPSH